MARYLTLPNCTRARHKTTPLGRKEAEETFDVAASIVLQIETELCSLGFLCEYLKANGLPGNEAARMRQWERFLSENFEKLRVVKRYRTRTSEEPHSIFVSFSSHVHASCLPSDSTGTSLIWKTFQLSPASILLSLLCRASSKSELTRCWINIRCTHFHRLDKSL